MSEKSVRGSGCLLPISRVKTIMKSSPDVSAISQDALYLIAKATVCIFMAECSFNIHSSYILLLSLRLIYLLAVLFLNMHSPGRGSPVPRFIWCYADSQVNWG